MREVKYLSSSSVKKFYANREEFYLQYLSEYKPPRPEQTQAMSVGSAFDAWIKHHLHNIVFGGNDPRFEIDNIIEKQVEPQHRAWARKAGHYIFKCYEKSGALANLILELDLAIEEPRMELRLEGDILHETVTEGIPIVGYPDLYFVNKYGRAVVFDWKVNGFCSKYAASPRRGYINIHDGWSHDINPPSRGSGKPHRDAEPVVVDGVTINSTCSLNVADKDWAGQLCLYAWLLGEPIGGNFVCCIDQIIAKPCGTEYPLLRVANHRATVDDLFQTDWFKKILFVWNTIKSGHIFTEMSREESDAKCEELDRYASLYEDDPVFAELTRS